MRIMDSTGNVPVKKTSSITKKSETGKSSGKVVAQSGDKVNGGEAPKARETKRAVQPKMSEQEIREKVSLHKSMKNAAKISPPASKIEEGEAIKNSEESEAPKSEIANQLQNDPNDPAVRGKLKSMLQNGGVNFSAKERGALEQILKE